MTSELTPDIAHAAAIEAAARMCENTGEDLLFYGVATPSEAATYSHCAGEIRALHTDAGKAALDALVAEAVRKERERCRNIAIAHRPDRPLASRATADNIAIVIMRGDQ